MKKIKTLEKYQKFISEISDERDNGDGVWVYLNKDYADFGFDSYNPTRQIHEQTVTSILQRLRYGVRKINEDDLKNFPILNK
jgi:hypothetical protein